MVMLYLDLFILHCLMLLITRSNEKNKQEERKHMSKPWITNVIRLSLNIKNNIYIKDTLKQDHPMNNKFKVYHNKLKRLIQISKKTIL
jgi:hypothetical protein